MQRLERPELLGDHERRVVRQHDPSRPDPDRLGRVCEVRDHDRRRRAGDPAQVVVLGDPVARVARGARRAVRDRSSYEAPVPASRPRRSVRGRGSRRAAHPEHTHENRGPRLPSIDTDPGARASHGFPPNFSSAVARGKALVQTSSSGTPDRSVRPALRRVRDDDPAVPIAGDQRHHRTSVSPCLATTTGPSEKPRLLSPSGNQTCPCGVAWRASSTPPSRLYVAARLEGADHRPLEVGDLGAGDSVVERHDPECPPGGALAPAGAGVLADPVGDRAAVAAIDLADVVELPVRYKRGRSRAA